MFFFSVQFVFEEQKKMRYSIIAKNQRLGLAIYGLYWVWLYKDYIAFQVFPIIVPFNIAAPRLCYIYGNGGS